ncbi:hypothetical protein [Neotamlana laminarinivorans]|uniref:Ferredoxin subunit of nitrite reductase or a ring-hydroxylating dioxygenase n=1 Tax=Neotamlana laminarinivorans TaxID=2883124 RepID=A0A9X1I236_9FLAO|nr:hypothetical protein [Tamlana laminarinivorans]MCB4799791.1 hypothetical protein [Tamlana laminarinivorans]
MKHLITGLFFLILFSCSGSINEDENCNFLLDIDVNLTINLTLPQYSELSFVGNSIYISGYGNDGIIIANTGSGYMAWDASDPNYLPETCGNIVPNGLFGTSECGDGNTYNFVTGELSGNDDATLQCALKNYRIQQSGNSLLIYN